MFYPQTPFCPQTPFYPQTPFDPQTLECLCPRAIPSDPLQREILVQPLDICAAVFRFAPTTNPRAGVRVMDSPAMGRSRSILKPKSLDGWG